MAQISSTYAGPLVEVAIELCSQLRSVAEASTAVAALARGCFTLVDERFGNARLAVHGALRLPPTAARNALLEASLRRSLQVRASAPQHLHADKQKPTPRVLTSRTHAGGLRTGCWVGRGVAAGHHIRGAGCAGGRCEHVRAVL